MHETPYTPPPKNDTFSFQNTPFHDLGNVLRAHILAGSPSQSKGGKQHQNKRALTVAKSRFIE